jgi:serine/threonine protein kinase
MSSPASVEELLELIRRSGVIEEIKLADFLHRHEPDEGLDPRACADDMVRDGVMTNFQAEQFLLGKWRGFTIGKYKLLERIGIGGMGQVFLCEHMHLKRRAALKVLPPAKAEQPAALGRFYREARAAAALQHPNVVRTHDIDQDGEFHFIVMDYIEGPNLLDLVKRFGALDVGRASSYVHQIAQALDFAFRNRIIHRDVKPGNVLIDRIGVARLLDLGLARFLNDHTDQLTLKYDDKIVLGTADYVAPEQILNSHAVDTRADIYALGATFYYLLAGHPIFPTGSVSQKLLWHRMKEPANIRDVRADVPEGLATIVMRMLAKDPKDRYQTPAQLISELERWLPEFVSPPRTEEMPRLSPASTEDLDEAAAMIDANHTRVPQPGSETERVSTSTSPTGTLTKPGLGKRPETSAWKAIATIGDNVPATSVRHTALTDTEETDVLLTPRPASSFKPKTSVATALAATAKSRKLAWLVAGAVILAIAAIVALVASNS